MLIKICGMKQPENIRQVAALNPDMMGFIFYPESARYIDQLAPESIKNLSETIAKIGIFVNNDFNRIIELAQKYQINTLQLHGNETPEECLFLRKRGFQIIKAIGIEKQEDLAETLKYQQACDLLLFDTKSKLYGGTGHVFDWGLLRDYNGNIPFLLSGGISMKQIDLLKQFYHPLWVGVDLNSQFEISPGIKDIKKLTCFLEALRS